MTRRGIILFVLLGVSWGIPYLLIKIAVGQLDPAMLVLARTGLAAVVLLPVAAARGEIMPVLRRWRPLAAFTLAEIIVPQFLLSSAEERLPSSTTGLLIAAVPLAGVGVALLLGRPERLTLLNWLGVTLGMAGVAGLVGFTVSGSDLGAVGKVLVVSGPPRSPTSTRPSRSWRARSSSASRSAAGQSPASRSSSRAAASWPCAARSGFVSVG
jgi:drug/metabolite transporter (DMT)-like permease